LLKERNIISLNVKEFPEVYVYSGRGYSN
jgi:hypothetical protein